MTEVYVFKDTSWWNNPPCDCCPNYLVETYTCISHAVDMEVFSEEECYIQALQDMGTVDDSVYELSLEQLEKLCVQNNIKVVIHD